MTQRGLNRLVQIWGQRLPTRGHVLTARFAKPGELDADDFGGIHWDDQLMTGEILLRPNRPRDEIVRTLIHEMLHPVIGLRRESATNLVAEAFWRAYRPRKRKP